MSQVKSRENTFKVDLSNFSKRPSFEELHSFVHNTLGLTLEQVKRLQINHAQNCAHVKCSDLKVAQDTVATHDGKHEIDINKTKVKVRLSMEDGGVEVKIHDLSENIGKDEILAFLRQYGEILSFKEMMWGDSFAFKGIPSGVRVAKMVLRRHIKSFVTVQGEQTLITYRNQPQTCRHCTNLVHTGMSCVENKRLIGQKVDLNTRLSKAAQAKPTSYAGVLSQSPAVDSLMPSFVGTNLNQLNRERARSSPVSAVAEGNDASFSRSAVATTQLHEAPGTSQTFVVNAADVEMETDQIEIISTESQAPRQPSDLNLSAPVVGAQIDTTTTSQVSRTGAPSFERIAQNDRSLSMDASLKSSLSIPNCSELVRDVSESENYDSAAESALFQTVKRGRCRLKKPRTGSSPPTLPQ